MSRRISSRDDLFLSALDMYTLLSFLFIGVAFMASYGSEERSILDLPLAPNQKHSTPDHGQSEALLVRFSPSASTGRPEQRCQVTVLRRGAFVLRENTPITLPCWPRAFGGLGLHATELHQAQTQWVREHPGREPEAVVVCRRDNLETCARLQWIMAEHGFRPQALVAKE